MKVLVTGGAGFIGSHLVEQLLADGHEVTVIDDMSMGKRENLPEHKNLVIHERDIMDDRDPDPYQNIEVVYHLVALTRPRESFRNPKRTFQVNVRGTQHALNMAKRAGVRRFVNISSATVYGNSEMPMKEEFEDLIPMSPYGESKLRAENLVRIFCNLYNMEFNIIRPFNVYGIRQNPLGEYGAAVPKFIDCFKNGRVPYITGDGQQFRDFIFVEDLVDLIVRAGESDIHGRIFNGGSGKSYSIIDILRRISVLFGRDVDPGFKQSVDDPNTLADISRAEGLLGWKPKTSLEEGLRTML